MLNLLHLEAGQLRCRGFAVSQRRIALFLRLLQRSLLGSQFPADFAAVEFHDGLTGGNHIAWLDECAGERRIERRGNIATGNGFQHAATVDVVRNRQSQHDQQRQQSGSNQVALAAGLQSTA